MTKVRILCAVHQYKKKFKSRLGATGTLGAWTLSTGVLLLRRERGSCMTMNDCWGVQMGSTVLHVACQRRREPVALMLVRLNCRTDLEDAVRCFTVFTHLGANCRSSGGVVGTGCTRDTEGRAFHSRPRAFSYQPWASCSHSSASVMRLRRSRVRLSAPRFQLTTLGKLFTLICLCHATPKVARSTPGLALSANNLGQVVHTHAPLSPSSIIWHRSRGGDALRLGR